MRCPQTCCPKTRCPKTCCPKTRCPKTRCPKTRCPKTCCPKTLWLLTGILLCGGPAGCRDTSGQVSWRRHDESPRVRRIPDEALERRDSGPVFRGRDLDRLSLAAGVTLETPERSDGKIRVRGTVRRLPAGWRIYILLSDDIGNYFCQAPAARLEITTAEARRFEQRNVRLGADIVEVHACLAGPLAIEEFERRAARSQWGGVATLPQDAVIGDTIQLK